MPIPTPTDGESRSDFMSRCMSDTLMVGEYPNESQRYAICNSSWGNKTMTVPYVLLEREDWIKSIDADPEDVQPMRKGVVCEVKAADDEERAFDMVISSEAIDRDNDMIRAAGWDITNYKKNPVVQWAHDHHIPTIARSVKTKVERAAKKLIGRPKFPEEGIHPFADMIYNLMKGKFLNAASVGFMPIDYIRSEERSDEGRRIGFDFLKQELLEYSIVNVPSNPEALVGAKAAGIDISPMREWAQKVLETDDGPGLWLPKHIVERALEIAENERKVIPVSGFKLNPANDDGPAVLHFPVELTRSDISVGELEEKLDDISDEVFALVNEKLGDPPTEPKPIDFTVICERCYDEAEGIETKLVDGQCPVCDPEHKEEPPTKDEEVTGEQLLAALLETSAQEGEEKTFTTEQLRYIGEEFGKNVVAAVRESVQQKLTAMTGRLD